jgi:hypothetical protein
MFRTRLRVGLAAALAVLCVVITPAASQAAVGPWVSVTIGLPPPASLSGGNCWVSFQSHLDSGSGALMTGPGGRCYGGPDITPGSDQHGEQGEYIEVHVSGAWHDSAGDCEGHAGFVLGDHPDNGTVRVAGSIPEGVVIPLNGADVRDVGCDIAEVCFEYFHNSVLDDSDTVCVSKSIPAPAETETTGECQEGEPVKVSIVQKAYPSGTSVYDSLEVSLDVAGGGPLTGWNFTAFERGQDSGVAHNQNPGGDIPKGKVIRWVRREATDPVPDWSNVLAGVEVYHFDGASPADDWNANQDPESNRLAASVPLDASYWFGGITDPGHCRWWFGEKVVNFPNTTQDEPFAAANSQVIPGPEVGDPPEAPDESNWTPWGGILSVLNSIWNAIKDLASSVAGIVGQVVSAIGGIVDDLLDGLVDLFVPADGFFDDTLDGFSDAMDGTTLGNYVDALGDITPAGTSSCAGPSISLPMVGPGTYQPLSACSGGMSSAAAATRVVIAVSVGLSAAFAVIRIVGRGFGWDPGTGGRE